MKERPILFSGPMVRAILEGRKTQTRRILKDVAMIEAMNRQKTDIPEAAAVNLRDVLADCPFGQPGDRLWVRETFCGDQGDLRYAADGDSTHNFKGWQPSIHMPRWASRITLEITDVRVERLQDISEEDAQMEGTPQEGGVWRGKPNAPFYTTARLAFGDLWGSIHRYDSPNGWAANPWVWVVTFKRTKS